MQLHSWNSLFSPYVSTRVEKTHECIYTHLSLSTDIYAKIHVYHTYIKSINLSNHTIK